MPRYMYKCDECKELTIVMHSSDEIMVDCEKCDKENTLRKLLTKPTYTKKHTGDTKIGQITEEFIESSRAELKQQREELEKKR